MAPHLFTKFLSKTISCSKLKTFHIYNLLSHWALSNCCDPLWDTFHTPMIKITYTPHIFANFYNGSCTRTLHTSILIIPQNKTPYYSWFLSPSYHCMKKDMGYAKRNKRHAQETMMKIGHIWRSKYSGKKGWTHEGPSISKKREPLQEMWWSMTKILWHFNRASQLHTIYDEFEGMDPRPRTLWRFIEFVIIEPTKHDVLTLMSQKSS